MELMEEVRIRGALIRKEGAKMEAELEKVSGKPDRILLGGPGNSLMAHEGVGRMGGSVVREVVVRKDGEGNVEGLESKYHLVEPVRLTMCERKVVGKVMPG
jgi:hypothetical protein